MSRRVVITGMGAISPFGQGVPSLWKHMSAGDSAIVKTPNSLSLEGLRCRVAALVPKLNVKSIDRKKKRFMSAMSIYATLAAQEAIKDAALNDIQINSRTTGLSFASTMGSSDEFEKFFSSLLKEYDIGKIKSTMFFKTMNHSCAANAAQALGVRGRVIAPSAACASGTLSIGLAYEAVAAGYQDIMIAVGADEYHCLTTAVFDIMNAASCEFNESPTSTPKPFDVDRDGVVCSEGAGAIVLESLESALGRNAKIFAEVGGFSTFSSPLDIANPDHITMIDCIEATLDQAKVSPGNVDYINAHATATTNGDIAETKAVEMALGADMKISSLKGHIGHAMAASGAIELIVSILMMNNSLLLPTRNLVNVDEACGKLHYLKTAHKGEIKTILKNSFALGGINSTLLINKYI